MPFSQKVEYKAVRRFEIKRRCWYIACLLLCFVVCYDVAAHGERDSVKIYFRQAYSTLDLSLRDNHKSLERITGSLEHDFADSVYQLKRIDVIGGASPEGSIPMNIRLSEKRAARLFDDLFGYNRNVDIVLPNVTNMSLEGYETALMHELFWSEDYITNDPNYDKGTKIKGTEWDSDKTNQRYRDINENRVEGNYYTIDFGTEDSIHYTIDSNGQSTYLSLTLGWNVGMITITKTGMQSGECAIFKIYKVEDGSEREYMTLLLSDQDLQPDGLTRSKQIALDSDGTWKIVETDWSWAYDSDGSKVITRELNAGTTAANRIFTFSNTPKDDAPIHSESLKVNQM